MNLIRKNWFSARVVKDFNSSELNSIFIFFVTNHFTAPNALYVFPRLQLNVPEKSGP